jgi:hypothetical protein
MTFRNFKFYLLLISVFFSNGKSVCICKAKYMTESIFSLLSFVKGKEDGGTAYHLKRSIVFLYISHSTNGRCVTEEEPEGFNKGRQCYQTTGL